MPNSRWGWVATTCGDRARCEARDPQKKEGSARDAAARLSWSQDVQRIAGVLA
jgi:hypothetical protein